MNIVVDENITLELTAEKHAKALFAEVDNNREHLSRFLPWVNHMQSVDDFKNYIRTCETLHQQNKEMSFVIWYNNVLVGRIGLHHLNIQNKTAAIGYWIGKRAEGRGIILKSCKTLISYGFYELGLNRIEIKAATDNHRSQAIPLKLNFKKEGVLREAELVNNKFLDLILFSILNNEWENSPG